MSRRIDIELTSSRPDGTWTWRAAGAREPKGVLDGALLPAGAATGSVYRADVEAEIDGQTVIAVTDIKGKSDKNNVLELIPSSAPFEAVTQVRARPERGERSDRGDRPSGDRDRRPRRDNDRPRGDRPGGDRPGGDRPGGDRPGGDRPSGDRRPRRDGEGADTRGPRPDRNDRRSRPSFTPPPELPQRPKAKRLKPGRAHRNAVLAELPEAQRPVAERALAGGIPAVRAAVTEQNAALRAEGKDEIPAEGLVQMAEQLLPRLRVAEWLDRADAAKADIEELDLRDLRSVVASSDDPAIARDESTREVAAELKAALAAKQEKELLVWFGDIDAAIGVGRVIRALKLSSQPPKAGVRFPAELAKRLADAATASLTPDALPDRWSAVLEAAAFSPVRAQVVPTAAPATPGDELLATVKRLGSLLPQIAALFGIEVKQGGAAPKPLRPTKPGGKPDAKPAAKKPAPIPPPPAPKAAPAAEVEVEVEAPAAELEIEAPAEVEAEVEAPSAEAEVEAPTELEVEAPADVEAPVEVDAPVEE